MFSKKAEVESRPKIVAMASDFMIRVRSVDHATFREIQLRGFRMDDGWPTEPERMKEARNCLPEARSPRRS